MKWLPLAAAVWEDRGVVWGKATADPCTECCFDAKDTSCFSDDSLIIRTDWAGADAPPVDLELFADEACTSLLLSLTVSPDTGRARVDLRAAVFCVRASETARKAVRTVSLERAGQHATYRFGKSTSDVLTRAWWMSEECTLPADSVELSDVCAPAECTDAGLLECCSASAPRCCCAAAALATLPAPETAEVQEPDAAVMQWVMYGGAFVALALAVLILIRGWLRTSRRLQAAALISLAVAAPAMCAVLPTLVMVGAAGRAWRAFVRNAPKPLEYERYFTIAGGARRAAHAAASAAATFPIEVGVTIAAVRLLRDPPAFLAADDPAVDLAAAAGVAAAIAAAAAVARDPAAGLRHFVAARRPFAVLHTEVGAEPVAGVGWALAQLLAALTVPALARAVVVPWPADTFGLWARAAVTGLFGLELAVPAWLLGHRAVAKALLGLWGGADERPAAVAVGRDHAVGLLLLPGAALAARAAQYLNDPPLLVALGRPPAGRDEPSEPPPKRRSAPDGLRARTAPSQSHLSDPQGPKLAPAAPIGGPLSSKRDVT